MRTFMYAALTMLLTASAALAQHAPDAAAKPASPTDIRLNVMWWVFVIFGVFAFILNKYFMPGIIGAVVKREKALEEAIEGAKRDREEAAKMLAEQRAQIEAARADAQRLINEGRATAEKMRHDLVEQTRNEQQEVLERARNEIGREKDRAIADLRREAIDLAIAGAGKVIEQNLDNAGNRKLVESYLGSLGSMRVKS
jgi:F-type H+-transporting ATPase subunit b